MRLSQFASFFYEARQLFSTLAALDGAFLAALQRTGQPIQFQNVQDVTELFCNQNSGDLEISFALDAEPHEVQEGHELPSRLIVRMSRKLRTWTAEFHSASSEIFQPPSGLQSRIHLQLPSGNGRLVDLGPYQRVFQALADAIYIGPVRHAVGTAATYFDISTGVGVVNAWQQLKAGASLYNREIALTLEDELARVFGYRTLEINAAHTGTELLVFLNKKSYFLDRLGSGFAQFLLVMVNLATRTPTFVLIDEPELSLHPSLQLEFIKMLYSRAPSGVIFATHNMGLAKDVADKIYAFRKAPDGPSEVQAYAPSARLSETLGELGYASLREAGFSRILLVEGPTEVKVVRHFVGLLGRQRTLLLPLGGGSMITGNRAEELKEVIQIAGSSVNLLALIDSERAGPGQAPKREHTEFQQVCSALGIQCHLLERRAMENYFTDAAVKKGVGPFFRGLAEFERLEDVTPHWKKKFNWRIAQEMARVDLVGTDLESFLLKLPG